MEELKLWKFDEPKSLLDGKYSNVFLLSYLLFQDILLHYNEN